MVFKDKIWVIAGCIKGDPFAADVWCSEDGSQWKQAVAQAGFRGSGSTELCVVFGSRIWRLSSDVWSSEDGAAWTRSSPGPGYGNRSGASSAVFKGRLFIIGGRSSGRKLLADAWSTADGIRWTPNTADAAFPSRHYHTSLVHDNRLWVLLGSDGESRSDVWASTDGQSFVRTDAP